MTDTTATVTSPTAGTSALVALDIDGTLLGTDMTVPAVTVEAVQDVRRSGHHVVLASDRSLVGVLPVARQLGIALERVRERIGVDPRSTVAVGDGVNDLEMLAWAARGVAMGHAPADVIDAAGEVTGTVEEHGVVAVLRTLR